MPRSNESAVLMVAAVVLLFIGVAHGYPTGYTIGGRAANGTAPLDGNVATEASFDSNYGGSLTAGGNLYFVDKTFNIVRLYNETLKNVTTIAGQAGVFGYEDGYPHLAKFSTPFATVVVNDPSTQKQVVIVSDQVNGCIRKVPTDGSNVSTLYGVCNGGATTLLDSPADVGVDSDDNLLVVDTNNDRILKVDVGTGVATVVIQQTNWRPLFLAIANRTFAFVVTTSFKLTTANFATGVIQDLAVSSNIPASSDYEVNSDLTTWEKDQIMYFISKDPNTFIYSLNTYNYGSTYRRFYGNPGEFKNHLNFTQGIKDGESPEFRDVTGMIALSINEVMIRQLTALRGCILNTPYTLTNTVPTQTPTLATHTLTGTAPHTATRAATRTLAPSHTQTINVEGRFLVSINLTALMGTAVSISALTDTFQASIHTATYNDIISYLTSRGYGNATLQPGTPSPTTLIVSVGNATLIPPDTIVFNVTTRQVSDVRPVQNETNSNPWTELKALITVATRAVAPNLHFCKTGTCQWTFSMVGLGVIVAIVAATLLILLLTKWGRTFLFNCLLLYPIML